MSQSHNVFRNRRGLRPDTSSVQHVREDFDSLRGDIASLATGLAQLATGQWLQAGSKIGHLGKDFGGRMNQNVRYVGSQVSTHPFAAVGIAAGIGFILGIALTGAAKTVVDTAKSEEEGHALH